MKKGIKELEELFKGMEILAEFVGHVWSDKKVSFEDIDDLVGLASKFDVLKEAFAGLSEIKEEAGDIDGAEAQALLLKAFAVGAAYEKGRKEG